MSLKPLKRTLTFNFLIFSFIGGHFWPAWIRIQSGSYFNQQPRNHKSVPGHVNLDKGSGNLKIFRGFFDFLYKKLNSLRIILLLIRQFWQT